MLVTCIFSLSIFTLSLLISYIWIRFLNNACLLFLIPIILGIFIFLYIMETFIVSKFKISKTIYNVITIQIPAIICILLSLILWLLNSSEFVIRLFLYSCKDFLIPIMFIRLLVEILIKRNISLIVSSGVSLGLIMGILATNAM